MDRWKDEPGWYGPEICIFFLIRNDISSPHIHTFSLRLCFALSSVAKKQMVHHMHKVNFYTWSMNAIVRQRRKDGNQVKCPVNQTLGPVQDAGRSHCPMALASGLLRLFAGTNYPSATLWSLAWSEVPPGEGSQPFPWGLVTHAAQSHCAWRTCLDFSLVLNLHMTASAGNVFHHPQLAGRPYLSWPG